MLKLKEVVPTVRGKPLPQVKKKWVNIGLNSSLYAARKNGVIGDKKYAVRLLLVKCYDNKMAKSPGGYSVVTPPCG